MSKKTVIIVTTCTILSLIVIMICVYFEWMYTKSELNLCQWITSDMGIHYLLGFAGSIASSVIAAVLFLIGVQHIIDDIKTKSQDTAEINFTRSIVAKEMHEDARQCFKWITGNRHKKELLVNQYFAGCIFDNLSLEREDFSDCNFNDASFENTELTEAVFCRSTFSNARFVGASLSYANFKDAEIDVSLLREANCLWKAIMPDGNIYDGSFGLLGDTEYAKKMGLDISDPDQFKEFYFGSTG